VGGFVFLGGSGGWERVGGGMSDVVHCFWAGV